MATLMQDTAHEQRATRSRVEAAGRELARYGLVVVVAWIGFMKFTAYEAEGIRPFVANSPLLSWVYGPMILIKDLALLGISLRTLGEAWRVSEHPELDLMDQ
jgi:reactive chlorine resistance protein C